MKTIHSKITTEPVLFIDATPDDGYVLRILRAHRENCDCLWSNNADGSEPSGGLYRQMNEDQRERARMLDAAIGTLAADAEEPRKGEGDGTRFIPRLGEEPR